MKSTALTVIAVMACLITGCVQQSKITAQEIAAALQMQKWTIKIPKDVASEKQLVLRLACGDSDRSIGNKRVVPSDITTVLFWRLDDGTYRCRIQDSQ